MCALSDSSRSVSSPKVLAEPSLNVAISHRTALVKSIGMSSTKSDFELPGLLFNDDYSSPVATIKIPHLG